MSLGARLGRGSRDARRAVLLLLALLIPACGGRAFAGCLDCHRGIEPIAAGRMQEEIERLGDRHQDPEGCVLCHGGDPRADTAERAHRGAPADLAAAGGPRAFHPDPGAPDIADRTCGQCHEGYAARWRKSSMSTETGVIDRELCDPAWRKRRARGNAEPSHFGRHAVQDGDGPEPAVGSDVYKTWMRRQLQANPAQSISHLLPVPVEPWPADGPHPSEGCNACHAASAASAHRPGCSACHIRRGRYVGADPTIPKDGAETPRLHRIQGSGRIRLERPDGGELGWPGIALENCFACHFDPRRIARNGIGDAQAHYGHLDEESGSGLWCQDCHTSIEMHGDGNIPANGLAQKEVRCEDCHGTVEKLPWELPLAPPGPAGESAASRSPRGLVDADGKPIDAADSGQGGNLLTSRGNPFGNVFRGRGRVYLRSVSGRLYPVTLLATLEASKGWRSGLSRQVKSSPELHQGMGCIDCHADWLPPCLGCHAGAEDASG